MRADREPPLREDFIGCKNQPRPFDKLRTALILCFKGWGGNARVCLCESRFFAGKREMG